MSWNKSSNYNNMHGATIKKLMFYFKFLKKHWHSVTLLVSFLRLVTEL